MSKVVILNGSPRRNGNTQSMSAAFAERAKRDGHEVETLDLQELKIHGCAACDACYTTGKPCVFDDDPWNTVAPDILTADVVVFSGPVYWYGMTAQLKAVLDRMYCLFHKGDEFTGKQTALLTCCMDEDESTMNGVRFAFERSVKLMGWDVIGEVLAAGVGAKGDAQAKGACDKSAALADLIS
ncbi:MAG: flavodoxin family protein [Atopobiaceae bacterium]|jgi:multimeric flavodoxin WrbA|nr:flavodoxin family protein [Atopobiaceae bacterium]MCH4214817.1 flavodoxin family protein [Atopobiaceae bacterium]MCH4230237.1 flavodoxin family protein [Atopobiaceae bacterium]MCH4276795.1 flavodoxin family protein [Atopobiaceae bacterium]MCI1226140.1 flavodoxin family protein [Atopobiaceae bacterium]